MKFLTLTMLYVLVTSIEAQNAYVPLKKAGKSSEYIIVVRELQITRLMKRIHQYPACKGLKADVRGMSRNEVSAFLQSLEMKGGISILYLRYDFTDSVDLSLVGRLHGLKELYLQNSQMKYDQIALLDQLKNLDKLSLSINNIGQLPPAISSLGSLSELELTEFPGKIINPAITTQLPLYYRLNDTLDNFIAFSSNLESIDLSSDSVKLFLMAMLPGAKEKKMEWDNSLWPHFSTGSKDVILDYTRILNPNFTPLFKNEQPEFEVLPIKAETDNTLFLNDGSELNIPSGAFMTKSGNSVKGEIKVLYRSIRTPLDILLSGVTMLYDTAGHTELFKTNGMFEVRAFAGKEELVLKKNKQLEMNFKSNQDTNSFNLYNLDENTGQWKYNSSLIWTLPAMKSRSFFTMKDKTSFAERYNSLDYTFLVPNKTPANVKIPRLSTYTFFHDENIKMGLKFKVYSKAETRELNRKIKYGRLLIRPRVAFDQSSKKTKKVMFYLLNSSIYKSDKRVRRYFPELAVFDGYAFEYDGELLPIEFLKKYSRRAIYSDCRLYYSDQEDHATIELKTPSGYIQIPVKMTSTLPSGKVKFNNHMRRSLIKYNKLLLIKESKFNKSLHTTYNLSYRKKLDTSIYQKHFSSVQATKGGYYKINIQNMGVFNCDQLYRIESPIVLKNTTFVCEGDTLISSTFKVYVVDYSAGGAYMFAPNRIILSYQNISGMVLRGNKGVIYTCNGDDFRTQVSPGKHSGITIQVEQAQMVKSAEEVVKTLTN